MNEYIDDYIKMINELSNFEKEQEINKIKLTTNQIKNIINDYERKIKLEQNINIRNKYVRGLANADKQIMINRKILEYFE